MRTEIIYQNSTLHIAENNHEIASPSSFELIDPNKYLYRNRTEKLSSENINMFTRDRQMRKSHCSLTNKGAYKENNSTLFDYALGETLSLRIR